MNTQDFFLARGAPRFKSLSADRSDVSEASLREAWAALFSRSDVDAQLSALQGDFAVACIDAQGHGQAAVDRFASVSLCWCLQDGKLRVAERAEDLAGASTELETQAVYDYLYFHCIPAPRTIYKGVYRLPAAHRLSYDGLEVKVSRYWTPQFSAVAKPDFAALKSEFLGLLKNAVREQLVDAGPAACFLSGGTDSSSVAGLIREVTGQGAQAFSIGFEAQGYDEMSYARLAARHFGAEHHEYYVTPQDIADSWTEVAQHYDQPFGNSSALPAFYCARMAQQHGVRKLLAGDGGDELFGGNARYAKQRVFSWYQQVPAAVRRQVMEPMLGTSWAQHVGLLRKAGSYVEQARVPMPARLNMYNLLLRVGSPEILSPEMLALVRTQVPQDHQQGVWDEVPGASELNTTLAFDWRYTLAESDLPKVVGMTRMAGVEVGFPLLDARLLDFSLRLPDAYKLRGLRLRWFFKEALRGFLPDEIITKSKHGFGLPFGVWVQQHAGLSAQARDALNGLEARGVLRQGFAHKLWTELLPLHPGYYGELVWILGTLELWLRGRMPDYRLR